jgi:hypothetical protein
LADQELRGARKDIRRSPWATASTKSTEGSAFAFAFTGAPPFVFKGGFSLVAQVVPTPGAKRSHRKKASGDLRPFGHHPKLSSRGPLLRAKIVAAAFVAPASRRHSLLHAVPDGCHHEVAAATEGSAFSFVFTGDSEAGIA